MRLLEGSGRLVSAVDGGECFVAGMESAVSIS
jgi:hypothetical protein